MTLRPQKAGRQKPWTLEQIEAGFRHFHDRHKRYPTDPEIDESPYLPSARTLERSFGGSVAVRKQLKLPGQTDFRNGKRGSARARAINSRAHKIEGEVYAFLVRKFGKKFVHREYFFLDDRRTRADFFVYDDGEGFCVDVFYPKDRRNLIGCLNVKLKKYALKEMQQYPIIFLQMNGELSQDLLDDVVEGKKKSFSRGQSLMGWRKFQTFCRDRIPLRAQ